MRKTFITERFETSLANFDAGNWQRAISAIAWPAGSLRSIFDLMSRDGEAGVGQHPRSRAKAVPTSLLQGCRRRTNLAALAASWQRVGRRWPLPIK